MFWDKLKEPCVGGNHQDIGVVAIVVVEVGGNHRVACCGPMGQSMGTCHKFTRPHQSASVKCC